MKTLKQLTILATAVVLLTTTCKKDVKFWLTETGTSSIDSVNVILNGSVVMEGEPDGSEYGVCYSATNNNPTLADSSRKVGVASNLTDFNSKIIALAPGNYSYCSYLKGKDKTQYGEVKNLSITPKAYIYENADSIIGPEAATIKVLLSNNMPLNVTSDVAWAKPAVASLYQGYMQSLVINVDGNVIQEDRTANISFAGEGFSKKISFLQKLLIVLPTLTTTPATSITTTSAISGGNITSDGGAAITARGICWATTTYPTVANSKTINGKGAGTFISGLTNLSVVTTYYIRAYATNSKGTAYGAQQKFTTPAITIPLLTTSPVINISYTAAHGGGDITSDGGAEITARGVCWATSANPVTTNSKTTVGAGTGTFTTYLTGLTPGTNYYVRAYATNSKGTAYGANRTFTTTAITMPVLTTTAATAITTTTATSGGNITSDGGATITARGVCWATTASPTVANSKTTDGAGKGTFASSLTGLTDGTTYYIRAYATNSKGTAYGNEQTFTTTAITIPVLTTTAATAITTTAATSGGNISSDGGATVTARGVCWATTASPTVANSKTTDGTGADEFTSSLTGLTASTTYYLRAYATNSKGTAYGAQQTFTTNSLPADVTNATTGKTWMYRNLGATQVATSSTDAAAYGDLYQWGRGTDGHEKRNSGTTSILSSSNTPGHGNFILALSSPYDWRSPQTDNLWQGASGVNNPCPSGYRLPTSAEWEAERVSWGSNDAAGAFASPLKLPMAGYRYRSSGSLGYVGSIGDYWSSTVSGSNPRYLYFGSNASMSSSDRAYGFSVRCLKE